MSKVQITQQAGETRLEFEPVLDVAGARDLYRELDAVLAQRPGVLALDASRVERVDASTLQLLAAFCRSARDAGLSLRWRGASPVLRDAAALLDIHETLGRPN